MTKKDKILKTTLKLMAEHGYNGTPMSMIVKKSGVAAGTIYHHFKNKDELVAELYSLLKQRMGLAIIDTVNSSLPYKERFKKYWLNLYTFYCNNYNEFRVLEYCASSPYIPEKIKEQNKIHYLPIVLFLEEGIKQEIIKKIDIELLLVLLHGNVVATVNLKLSNYKKFTPKFIDIAIESCWKGIVN